MRHQVREKSQACSVPLPLSHPLTRSPGLFFSHQQRRCPAPVCWNRRETERAHQLRQRLCPCEFH
nr:MAG TPA: hypothetical protein [Caudoviricetes sp.]